MHLSEEYLALGAPLGAGDGAAPVLGVSAAAREAAAALLEAHAPGARASGFLVLGPGALYGPAKRWSAARFAELGRRWARRGLAVLVCGTAGEAALCAEVAAAIGSGGVSLAGHTSLPEQAALCAGARAVACNDSGLAHLAAAVGAPTVALFGSTSSAWTAPLGPRVRVVQHAPVCSPCFRRRCVIGYRCLEAIEVAEVERACEAVAA
jgi:heptosyltransferase-2